MFHVCVAIFDVTKNLEKFWKLNKAQMCSVSGEEEGHEGIFPLAFFLFLQVVGLV